MSRSKDPDLPSGAEVDRPQMPSVYGLKGEEAGFLPWGWASERLENARNYWIGSSWPDGRPHANPVWGVWHEGAVYFGTGRETRKGRNLAARPEVVVHLESGDEVVILEGAVEEVDEKNLLDQLSDAFEAKYDIRPPLTVAENVIYRVRPRKVLAWREKDFPECATRWRFSPLR